MPPDDEMPGVSSNVAPAATSIVPAFAQVAAEVPLVDTSTSSSPLLTMPPPRNRAPPAPAPERMIPAGAFCRPEPDATAIEDVPPNRSARTTVPLLVLFELTLSVAFGYSRQSVTVSVCPAETSLPRVVGPH